MKAFKILSLLFLTIASASVSAARALEKTLIDELYAKHNLMFLAASNHDKEGVYSVLESILERKMYDPALRHIIIERAANDSSLYECISVYDLDTCRKKMPDKNWFDALCSSNEWAFSVSEVFPKIRSINQARTNAGQRPILVKSVDSVSSDNWTAMPGFPLVKDDTCVLQPSLLDGGYKAFLTSFTASGDREIATAKNFENFLKGLRPAEKVIVVYHYAHIVHSFESCMPFQEYPNIDQLWLSRWTRLSWLDHLVSNDFLRRNQFAAILVDEQGGHTPTTTLKLTARLREIHEGDFSALLSRFSSEPEKGLDVFSSDSFLHGYHGGSHRGTLSVSEQFDGLIYFQNSGTIRNGDYYLPALCSQ